MDNSCMNYGSFTKWKCKGPCVFGPLTWWFSYLHEAVQVKISAKSGITESLATAMNGRPLLDDGWNQNRAMWLFHRGSLGSVKWGLNGDTWTLGVGSAPMRFPAGHLLKRSLLLSWCAALIKPTDLFAKSLSIPFSSFLPAWASLTWLLHPASQGPQESSS